MGSPEGARPPRPKLPPSLTSSGESVNSASAPSRPLPPPPPLKSPSRLPTPERLSSPAQASPGEREALPESLRSGPAPRRAVTESTDAAAEVPVLDDREAVAFWRLRKGNRKHAMKREASRWSKRAILASVFIIPAVAALSLFQFHTIPSDSMQPTVGSSDIVVSWRFGDKQPKVGEVVVFDGAGTDWGDDLFLKRVIAGGGDSIKCCTPDDKLILNGEPLNEPYLTVDNASEIGFQHEVKEGYFFALGDNREDSLDSRRHVDAYLDDDTVVAKPFAGFSPSRFRFYTL